MRYIEPVGRIGHSNFNKRRKRLSFSHTSFEEILDEAQEQEERKLRNSSDPYSILYAPPLLDIEQIDT